MRAKRGVFRGAAVGFGLALTLLAACQPHGQYGPTTPMRQPRVEHTATALISGKVLVAGGRTEVEGLWTGPPVATAERYDPAQGNWQATASMLAPRAGHVATRLARGKVLVTGGDQAPPGAPVGASGGRAELYDTGNDRWLRAADMPFAFDRHVAALTGSAEVLVVYDDTRVPDVGFLYDPRTDRWRYTPPPPARSGPGGGGPRRRAGPRGGVPA